MARFLFLFVFVFSLNTGLGQLQLRGKISDGTNFLTGVSVQMKNPNKIVISDDEGTFQISGLFPSSVEISFSIIGYKSLTKSFRLDSTTKKIDLGTIVLNEAREDLKSVIIGGNTAT